MMMGDNIFITSLEIKKTLKDYIKKNQLSFKLNKKKVLKNTYKKLQRMSIFFLNIIYTWFNV